MAVSMCPNASSPGAHLQSVRRPLSALPPSALTLQSSTTRKTSQGLNSSLLRPLSASVTRMRGNNSRRVGASPRCTADVTTLSSDADAEDTEGQGDSDAASALESKMPTASAGISLFEVDAAAEADLKANGFRSTRRTKLIATVGPACESPEALEALAIGGMNVARLNMCHGTHDWHRRVIRTIRQLNEEKGFAVAVMMDTEGSEIHMGDLGGEVSRKAEDGADWVFTVRAYPPHEKLPANTIQVNYDGFVDDVQAGDEISVDGGMVRFQVLSKVGPDVLCRVTDPGLLLPRANLTFFRGSDLVRARNAMLPTISSKDWIDIDFGIAEEVDFLAISFVKSPDVLTHLRSYIKARSPNRYIGLVAKIESSDSIPRLHEIVAVSDGAMVARGDLGAQIPLELVPAVQQAVVVKCRELNKPVIVASQLLESMIEFPTPTRAEVADVAEAVQQRADALMLSGESAMGQFPDKALGVLRTVAARMEAFCRQDTDPGQPQALALAEPLDPLAARAASGPARTPTAYLHKLPFLSPQLNDLISEELCRSAAQMARNLKVDAIFVYTRRGYMASLLSRCRPDCPIFAFTDSQDVRQRLNLYWGLIPFLLDFKDDDMEDNLQRTFRLLKARGMLKVGALIISVTAPAGGVPSSPAFVSTAQQLSSHSASGALAAGRGKPSVQIRIVT